MKKDCECCNEDSTSSEIIGRHGTLREFDEACYKAFVDGFITHAEYLAGVEKYSKRLKEAVYGVH